MTNITPELLLTPEIKDEQLTIEPHNIDAEQIVLGNLLTNNEAYNKIGDFLRKEHFYEPIHQKLYEVIVDFYNKGLIATPITLKHFFDNSEEFRDLGGSKYLSSLAMQAALALDIKDYAKLVFDLYLKRKLKSLGSEIISEITKPKELKQSNQIIEATEQQLFNLASEGNLEGDFKKLSFSLNQALETVNNSRNSAGGSGIPVGLLDLDRQIGGLQNSDLLILAGRPSMGKTALAINMAVNICEHLMKKDEKKSVGFYSLEMSSEQLASRIISMKSGVNAKKFRSGNFTNEDFGSIVKANANLQKYNLFIDDTPAISISAIRTRARRMKRKNNLAVLFVDYLQLIRGASKSENRVQEISEITQGLKAIAKELNIPVIALSQLSRAVELRDDKRPQLSDLRESGTIEQDSDIVMFIYREEYYLERKQPKEGTKEHDKWQDEMENSRNKTEVIVAKHRHGPIGNVQIRFDGNTTSFSNLALMN